MSMAPGVKRGKHGGEKLYLNNTLETAVNYLPFFCEYLPVDISQSILHLQALISFFNFSTFFFFSLLLSHKNDRRE